MGFSIEKLECLRELTKLSFVNNAKINFFKKRGVSQNEIDVVEYTYRFAELEKEWYSTWKKSNWGMKEDESLSAFVNSILEQEVAKKNKKIR